MSEARKSYYWIANIIESCKDSFHFQVVDKIIELFGQRFDDKDLLIELEALKVAKYNLIHGILV